MDAVKDQIAVSYNKLKGTLKRYISTDMKNTDHKILENDHNVHNRAEDVK